ncbi:hypothetical protein MADA3029_830021 [Vibrio nigripulchritudo MADA3029]|uniref:Uncharacterized protein n=2 Tax=Vibrio nigripulchritudo TaxID=28173 RepID=U4KAY2_9VIBR|nr:MULTISPECIES: DUF1315 family protein [Vibrio]EGU61093.1 hypothetical protein VINI7043_01530 [Vibrio nigripulchritudo ATCC 27043]KJY79833.1 hypothetical protein TW74_08600 [Vibrio nigripulchritudo]UAB71766.1 DUF1315 family protein [Vibrio sp. SCSIO 43132]CCN37465.1 hypothetical protein VIBNIAM115_600010 [Vibrio nigripulchritudo AM115]CCN44846.1 hypothetical protein VIBNIFTn2_930021 [Vibrio nigripulchritudo FTn2]
MNGNSFNLIVHGLPDEVYSEFKRALRKGYWRNGMLLTAKQKEAAQRAILVRETQTTAALQ